MTIWRAGMKAVCIRDKYVSEDGEICPVAGEVYTVRSVHILDEGVYLRLKEIVNQPRLYADGFVECEYNAVGFRPVTERKSENKHFEVLRDLLKNPHKVLEEA